MAYGACTASLCSSLLDLEVGLVAFLCVVSLYVTLHVDNRMSNLGWIPRAACPTVVVNVHNGDKGKLQLVYHLCNLGRDVIQSLTLVFFVQTRNEHTKVIKEDNPAPKTSGHKPDCTEYNIWIISTHARFDITTSIIRVNQILVCLHNVIVAYSSIFHVGWYPQRVGSKATHGVVDVLFEVQDTDRVYVVRQGCVFHRSEHLSLTDTLWSLEDDELS